MPSSRKPSSSRSNSGARPLQPEDTPRRNEKRRARRRREREQRDENTELSNSNGDTQAGPSRREQNGKEAESPTKRKNAFVETDFIAFTFSDDEREEKRPAVREWDKGKGRAYEREIPVRKRGSDEIDFDGGYTNKKQRVAAASRKAPWTADVDWDTCTNVAEMYVDI